MTNEDWRIHLERELDELEYQEAMADYRILIAAAREAQAQLRSAIEVEGAEVSFRTLRAFKSIVNSHTALIDALGEATDELERLAQ